MLPTSDLAQSLSLTKARFRVDYLRKKTRKLLNQLGHEEQAGQQGEHSEDDVDIIAVQPKAVQWQSNYNILDKRLEFQPYCAHQTISPNYENLTNMQRISPYQRALDDYMQYVTLNQSCNSHRYIVPMSVLLPPPHFPARTRKEYGSGDEQMSMQTV